MLIIGITGGIGSGKTTAAKLFAELGIEVVDADTISRQLVMPGSEALNKILNHFGSEILQSKGELNRKKLRDIIFQNPQEKKWLETLLHPLVYNEMQKQAKQCKSPYCVMIIPLLFETGGKDYVDRILVINATKELQIKRASKRDSVTMDAVKKIIYTQIDSKQSIQKADDVINNGGDLAELKEQITRLHEKYLHLALP